MSVTRRKYTPEFKAQVVELIQQGTPVPQLSNELGIKDSVLYRWVQETSQAGQAADQPDAATELRRLRRENSRLKCENSILKKAAVILGTSPSPNDGK